MYRVPFFCSSHGPEVKINERFTAESGRPISYGVRKRMPHPTPLRDGGGGGGGGGGGDILTLVLIN